MSADVQVETGRIPALKVHHDYRGDYGMEEVERSPPSYLSTSTTSPSIKPPSLTGPPASSASFSMAAAKAGRFQQHEEVFSHLNSGMELGSPKVSHCHPTSSVCLPLCHVDTCVMLTACLLAQIWHLNV